MNQYPPCANHNIPSDTPQLDAQTTKKNIQMDSKFRSVAAWGIAILDVVTVRPYILDPQHMHTPKRELVLRLAWLMSTYN